MPFCKFSSELIYASSTKVDNIFIETYLPSAPSEFVKIYLYGLYKCGHSDSADNTIESFSKILNLSEDIIIDAFRYWESENLVVIVNVNPIEVKYLEPKHSIKNYKKRDAQKYHNFNLQIQSIIEGRMIEPNEYLKYYETLETYHIEETALIMIAKYCTNLKGTNINAEYIIRVASAWAHDGYKTAKQVEEKILESEKAYGKLKDVLVALGINRPANIDERERFSDWQKKLGFSYDVIFYVAKNIVKNKASFNKLNNKLEKYASLDLKSIKEIESYEKTSKQNLNLTKDIVKNLSLYFENLETPCEVYVLKWINQGFSAELLKEISTICFKKALNSKINALEFMDEYLAKLYNENIISDESFHEYAGQMLATDKEIKKVLAAACLQRPVNTSDRSFYRTWTFSWKFDTEAIVYVATLAANAISPMQYINKVLSNLAEKNLKSITEIKKQNIVIDAPKKKEFEQHSYTKEEADAVFSNLDEFLNS